MKQSRLMSAVESATNIVVGYILAVITQVVAFPWWGIEISLFDNMALGLVFMGVAIVRSYGLRRIFEHIRHSRAASGRLPR